VTVSSSVPDQVDLELYAGDTFTRRIVVHDPALTEGCTWVGEIRRPRDSATVDEVFTIVPDVDGGATMSLTAEQTRALAEIGVVRAAGKRAARVVRYSGEWDVQVSKTGYVRTLVQGVLTVDLDVTRDTP
jgi:hypothetical protein